MAWTQSDLDTLRTAMRKGVKSVAYGNGETVTYQSLGEMIELEKVMVSAIATASGADRFSRLAFSRD